MFESRRNDELDYYQLTERINTLLEVNRQLAFVRNILDAELHPDYMVLLVLFCHLFVNNEDDEVREHDINFIYENKTDWCMERDHLRANDHFLQQNGYIEFNNSDGMADTDSMHLTRMAKKTLLSELHLPMMADESKANTLVRASGIAYKRMFYAEDVERQIAELGRLLGEQNY